MRSDHRIEAKYMEITHICHLPRVLCKSTRHNADPADQHTGPAVCESPKCEMRLEEAQSALESISNRDVRMMQLTRQFCRQYADDVAAIARLVTECNVRRKNRNNTVDTIEWHFPSTLGGMVQNAAYNLRRAQAMKISDERPAVLVAEYREIQRQSIAILENVQREFERLQNLDPIVQGVNQAIEASNYGCFSPGQCKQIKAMVSTINNQFPGSVVYEKVDGVVSVTALPAANEAIERAASTLAAEAYEKELVFANELVVAVAKREAGPLAYLADIVLDPAQEKYVDAYKIRATWAFPRYIRDIIKASPEPSGYWSRRAWEELRAIVDDPIRAIYSSGEIRRWIEENQTASDPWPADTRDLPGLWFRTEYGYYFMCDWDDSPKEPVDVTSFSGKNKNKMQMRPVVTAKQLKTTIATMLHMYEVLIDRVYGSRKRRADDDEGSAKRAAADDSMDS